MKRLIASLILSSLISCPALAQGTIVPTDTLPPVIIEVPFCGEEKHPVEISEEKLEAMLCKLSMEAQREQLEGNQVRVIIVHLMMSYLASKSSITETQWKAAAMKELVQTEMNGIVNEYLFYAADLADRVEKALTDE